MKTVCGIIKEGENNYSAIRMISGAESEGFVRVNIRSLRIELIKILGKMFPFIKKKDAYSFRRFFYFHGVCSKKINVIHTCNRVCKINKKWVCSFESKVPAYFESQIDMSDKAIKKRLKYIENAQCLKLLAWSQFAYNYEMVLLNTNCEEKTVNQIKKKIEILYPPQKLLVNEVDTTKYTNIKNLQFIYVGREFFRKGGYHCLCVFRELRKRYPLQLTLIGNVNNKADGKFRNKNCDCQEIMKEISANGDWIHYYEEMDNAKVLGMIKSAHVGLLPTYGDTFGFSVLEMQACGTPVITTNRQALREINNDKCGWIIDTYHYADISEWTYLDRKIEKYEKFIQGELYKIVEDICENPEQIQKKAVHAHERIKVFHSPEKYSARLAEIYEESLTDQG